MHRRSYSILLCALLMTTACTTAKLEELRQTAPKGTPLQIALAREYLAASEAEAANYDWADSYYFADKGLRSAYGQVILPDNPHRRDIKAEKLPELERARRELLAVLDNPEKVSFQATVAARAQSFYDCWVEQQEEAWQQEEIDYCQQGFRSAMEELNVAMLKTDAVSVESLPQTTAYMLFFNHNEHVITSEGRHVLQKVIDDILAMPEGDVVLNGHTDTSGADEYNMSLSEKRAMAVRAELAKAGVEENRVSYYAFGETDLRVKTPDGVREPGNRRVEIFLE